MPRSRAFYPGPTAPLPCEAILAFPVVAIAQRWTYAHRSAHFFLFLSSLPRRVRRRGPMPGPRRLRQVSRCGGKPSRRWRDTQQPNCKPCRCGDFWRWPSSSTNRPESLQSRDKAFCRPSGALRCPWSCYRWPLKSVLCCGSSPVCKPSFPALAVALAARQRRLGFRCSCLA